MRGSLSFLSQIGESTESIGTLSEGQQKTRYGMRRPGRTTGVAPVRVLAAARF